MNQLGSMEFDPISDSSIKIGSGNRIEISNKKIGYVGPSLTQVNIFMIDDWYHNLGLGTITVDFQSPLNSHINQE